MGTTISDYMLFGQPESRSSIDSGRKSLKCYGCNVCILFTLQTVSVDKRSLKCLERSFNQFKL